MEPVIDHIQITVRDMDVAIPFYDRLLPLLGFDAKQRIDATVPAHELHVLEYGSPRLCFAISSPRAGFENEPIHRRKPGSLHHLAFRAESREEVDRIHAGLVAIGVPIVDGPRVFPQHGPNHYAVFFKDLEGIKYEVVCGVAPPT